jgi:hypothetical protein
MACTCPTNTKTMAGVARQLLIRSALQAYFTSELCCKAFTCMQPYCLPGFSPCMSPLSSRHGREPLEARGREQPERDREAQHDGHQLGQRGRIVAKVAVDELRDVQVLAQRPVCRVIPAAQPAQQLSSGMLALPLNSACHAGCRLCHACTAGQASRMQEPPDVACMPSNAAQQS